jgi:hypothetical protein
MTYPKIAIICLILICVVLHYADEIDGVKVQKSEEKR